MSGAPTSDEHDELAALRERVRALEAERTELMARTAQTVAAAQQRAYWLDRWHLDLNALMARPGAAELRGAVRIARAAVRRARLLKRALLRSR